MGLKLYEESSIQNIANAIRAKGVSGSFTVGEMASAVSRISSGSSPSGTIVINDNGFTNVSNYAEAFVNVGIGYLRFVVDANGSSLYTGSSDEECMTWINSHSKTVKWIITPVFCVN